MKNYNRLALIGIMGGTGFLLATLLMALGFFKTLFIIFVMLVGTYSGYLLDKRQIVKLNRTPCIKKLQRL